VREVARAVKRDAIEAPRICSGEGAGDEVLGVERLERVMDDDRVAWPLPVDGPHRPVDHVEQLPDGDGGRALGVRALVAAGVGDEKAVARRHQRVEQQLAVLRARVALTDVRVVQAEVVAVARGLAREDAVVQAEQADDAVGDRPHRHERAERQVARAEVGPGGAALEPFLQERPDFGEGDREAAGGPGLLVEVLEKPVELAALPRVAVGRVRQQIGGPADRRRPLPDRFRLVERRERVVEPIDELGEAPGELDGPAVDVVQRQHVVDQPPLVLGHRHAHEDALQSRGPRALLDPLELEGLPPSRVEPPPDAALGHPLLEPRQILVIEAEPPADRLVAGEVQDLRRGDPVVGEVEERGDHREHRVRLTDGPVGEPDPQIRGRRAGRLAVLVRRGRTERGMDQRREGLDVRAHDDDVARLERRVVAKEVQDRVPQHLDLARAAVAGVDLDAAVARSPPGITRRHRIRPDVGLDVPQQRVRVLLDRVVVVHVVGALQNHLHLARVAAPGGEQAVRRQLGGRILAPDARRHRDLVDLVPQRGGRVQEEQVQVAPSRERFEDVPVAGGKPRQPEDRHLRGQIDDIRVRLQHLTRPLQALRRPGLADPRPQAPPQPPLPLPGRRLLRRGPRQHGVRAVQRVPVEQLGQMPNGREPPRPLQRIGPVRRSTEVCRQQLHPRLAEALVDDLEQRPHGSLRQPRIGLRLHARRRGHGRPHQPPGRREVHVRADPEPSRQLLRDPPLHPPSRDSHDLLSERVAGRRCEQRPERLDEAVSATGAVEVKHPVVSGSPRGAEV
jgi:hypothetical protein